MAVEKQHAQEETLPEGMRMTAIAATAEFGGSSTRDSTPSYVSNDYEEIKDDVRSEAAESIQSTVGWPDSEFDSETEDVNPTVDSKAEGSRPTLTQGQHQANSASVVLATQQGAAAPKVRHCMSPPHGADQGNALAADYLNPIASENERQQAGPEPAKFGSAAQDVLLESPIVGAKKPPILARRRHVESSKPWTRKILDGSATPAGTVQRLVTTQETPPARPLRGNTGENTTLGLVQFEVKADDTSVYCALNNTQDKARIEKEKETISSYMSLKREVVAADVHSPSNEAAAVTRPRRAIPLRRTEQPVIQCLAELYDGSSSDPGLKEGNTTPEKK